MEYSTILNAIGMFFSIAGTIIIAFSFNKYTKIINLSITNIESWTGIQIGNGEMDDEFNKNKKIREHELKRSNTFILTGLFILIVGLSFQFISNFFK